MKQTVAIIIPIFKEEMSYYETISMQQCFAIFENHPIIFVCPQYLKSTTIHKEYQVKSKFIFLENNNFQSIISYNKMLLSVWFYKMFSNYKYILIYQLDCFVFKDELNYWAEKKYSYIGAPWFIGNSNDNSVDAFSGVGNGGFSLRNVNHCIRVLSSNKKLCSLKETILLSKPFKNPMNVFVGLKRYFFLSRFSNLNQNSNINEDKVFAQAGKRFNFFNIPIPEEAIPFAFEMQPEKLYKLNNEQLPFGCHAWSKYNVTFYKKFIEHFGYNLENDLHQKTNH